MKLDKQSERPNRDRAAARYRGRQLGAPQRRLSKRHGAQPRGIGVRIQLVATQVQARKVFGWL